jgi:ABC-2 type transport system permease protein
MSTIPETRLDPADPTAVTAPTGITHGMTHGMAQAETAPSAVMTEGPGFARLIGFIGLFLLVLGAVVVIATRVTGTPRLVSEGTGFLFGAFGLALLLYHASADHEEEVRRIYGGFALFWMVFGILASVLPGPVFDSTVKDKIFALNMVPWGVGAGVLGLLFAIPFCRHETDELYRDIMLYTLLGVGAVLTVGSVAVGVMKSDTLTGHASHVRPRRRRARRRRKGRSNSR